jgi:hypothetical protein
MAKPPWEQPHHGDFHLFKDAIDDPEWCMSVDATTVLPELVRRLSVALI